jgi:aminoglycoside phosphotransferase (APT) family kinase protein
MRAACREVGLSADDAELIRLGENALYHLVTAGVVVRVARTMDYWEDAVREVAVSRWLHDVGLPAARVAEGMDQPLEINRHPVTFWHYIPGEAAPYSRIGDLGALLRRLHELTPPAGLMLPQQNILDRVGLRVEKALIGENDRRFLLGRLEELRGDMEELTYELQPCALHGDAHIKNLMVCGDKALLIDFERFAYGQPEWDLGMTATEYRTAGWWTPEEYETFTSAYGYDVTNWSGFGTVQAVHQLKMTTWIMQNVQESQQIADEFESRMRTIRDGLQSTWSPR